MENCRLAFSVAEDYLGISPPVGLDPSTLVHCGSLDINILMDFLNMFYIKFSDQSPQPATRGRNKGKDIGLGDSLSSSFSSSDSSLTSSILFSYPNESKIPVKTECITNHYEVLSNSIKEEIQTEPYSLSPEKPPRSSFSHHRSFESLLGTEYDLNSFKAKEARRQKESFTKALQKFSSLSNSNIAIKLPAFTFPHKSPGKPEKMMPVRNRAEDEESEVKHYQSIKTQTDNKEMLTSSTQTECLEDHGLQLLKTHENVRNQQNSYQSYVDNTDNLYWNSCDMYYSTQYSDCYQMYSTLV